MVFQSSKWNWTSRVFFPASFTPYYSISFLFGGDTSVPWVPEDIFFLSILMVGGEALSCPNGKHSLFHIRYFETSVSQGNTSGAANDMFSVKYLFGEA